MNKDKKMQCHPDCKYFRDCNNIEWEYDLYLPYIKRRKIPASFYCDYDGHKITNWYESCPKHKKGEEL